MTARASTGSGSGSVPKTTVSSGSAYTLAAPAHGETKLVLTLTASCTLTLSGGGTAGEGCAVQLSILQDSTGSRAITWPGNIDWGVQGAPVLSTAAGKYDRVYLSTDDAGTTWQGALVGSGYAA